MKVLVTGGGGFIGSHLVQALLEDGSSITSRRVDERTCCTSVHLSISSRETSRATSACTTPRWSAKWYCTKQRCRRCRDPSKDPLTSNASNVIGTLKVLLAARDNGVRRVIFASSSSVYGASAALPKQKSQTPPPISPYGVAKLAGEGHCRSFHAVYGLETVALRYFNVFGPRQDPSPNTRQ